MESIDRSIDQQKDELDGWTRLRHNRSAQVNCNIIVDLLVFSLWISIKRKKYWQRIANLQFIRNELLKSNGHAAFLFDHVLFNMLWLFMLNIYLKNFSSITENDSKEIGINFNVLTTLSLSALTVFDLSSRHCRRWFSFRSRSSKKKKEMQRERRRRKMEKMNEWMELINRTIAKNQSVTKLISKNKEWHLNSNNPMMIFFMIHQRVSIIVSSVHRRSPQITNEVQNPLVSCTLIRFVSFIDFPRWFGQRFDSSNEIRIILNSGERRTGTVNTDSPSNECFGWKSVAWRWYQVDSRTTHRCYQSKLSSDSWKCWWRSHSTRSAERIDFLSDNDAFRLGLLKTPKRAAEVN